MLPSAIPERVPRPSAGGETMSGDVIGTSNGVRSDDAIGMLDREDMREVVGRRTLSEALVGIARGKGR